MAAAPEPIFDLAHLTHIELLTPNPEASLWFFTHVLSLREVERRGQSVYLRAYGDYQRYSLKLTEAKRPGLGHAAFRTTSPAALERRVAALQRTAYASGWAEGDAGDGPAFQFTSPDGHSFELLYELRHFVPAEAERPYLKNQPQQLPHGGARARSLDHLNLLANEVTANKQFFLDTLGFRLSEQIVMDDGRETAAWMRVTAKSYDLVFTNDATGSRGRLHHLAYRVDNREDLLRTADLYTENGIQIETGPNKHPAGQTFFLYALEPGGNRVEVCAGGYLIMAPDWEPITWTETERKRGQGWGTPTVPSFHSYGTPDVALLER